MPIRNWGGGTDPSSIFMDLQDQFLREAQAARDRALQASQTGGGGSSGGSGGRGRNGRKGASGSVREGVADIAARMAAGQTNWRELLNYYRSEFKNAKKGSALANALKANIQNIEYVLTANGIAIPAEGPSTISSPDEAAPSVGVLTEDDVLTPEVEDLLNEQILYVSVTENGLYPAGENPLTSIVERSLVDGTIEELRDALIGDAKMFDEVINNLVDGRDAVITDPVSRRLIEVTPETMMDVVYQAMNNQMALMGLERGLGPDGDFAGRLAQYNNLVGRVDNLVTSKVFSAPDLETGQPKIFKGVDGYMDAIFRDFNLLRNTALSSTDPYEAQMIMKSASRTFSKQMTGLDKYLATLPSGIGPDPETFAQIQYSLELSNFLSTATSNQLAPDEIAAQAAALFDKRPEGFYLTSSDLETTFGGTSDKVGTQTVSGTDRESPGWTGVIGAASAVQGLEVNNLTRQGAEGELVIGDKYVWVSRYGDPTPTAVQEDRVSEWLNTDGDYHESAFPFVEKVTAPDGSQHNEIVWRQMAPLSEIQDTTWYAKVGPDGKPLRDSRTGDVIWATEAEYRTFGNDLGAAANAGFMPLPMEALAGILTVIGNDGRTYYVTDNKTGLHINMPFDTPINGEFVPYQLVDSNGHMDTVYRPVNGMMVGIGAGVTRREAQQMLDEAYVAGEIRAEDYQKYDSTGIVIDHPADEDVFGSIWSPMDESMFQHAEVRNKYQRDNRQRMELAQRQRKARKAEELAMQEQMLREVSAPNKAGAPALVDNSIEKIASEVGVTFGRGGKRTSDFNRPPALPRAPEAPPLTMDDLSTPAPPSVPDYTTPGKKAGVRPI